MNLDPTGREYVHWPVSGAPDDTLVFEAQFTSGTTVSDWLPVETVSATEARALVAGPSADQGTAIYQLPAGRTRVKIRAVDTPEIIVRGGGTIEVK